MTQKFTLSNRPSRMYLICRKLFEGFSKPLLPLSVPKVHGTRYYGSLILGRVLERISPAKSWLSRGKSLVPKSFVFGTHDLLASKSVPLLPTPLFLSGIPASDKSTYGKWLERAKGFMHLDVEKNGV